jgi:hypothetical protein
MIFKLAEAAERNWRRLNGHNQLPKLILGVRFTDGIEVVRLCKRRSNNPSVKQPSRSVAPE